MASDDMKFANDEREGKSLFTVDRYMIPSKIAFLFTGGMLGSHIPFLNIFFTSVGLSPGRAGFISGIRYLPSTSFYLVWGALVDHTGRRKLILFILCLGSALPIFSMPWVARFLDEYSTNETCNLQLNSNSNLTNGNTEHCKRRATVLFYVFLAIMSFASIFVGPLPGYIDTIIMNVVKSCKTRRSFGWQRTFSSLGLGLANFGAGVAADHYNYPGMSNYTAVLIIFLLSTLLLIPPACFVIDQASWDNKVENKDTANVNQSVKLKQLASMFKKLDVIFFMCTAFIAGLACMIYLGFVFLLLNDELHSTKTQMGLALVVSSLSEIIAFALASKMITFFRGAPSSIIVGMFSYFLRFILMSYATNFWYILCLQSLHGIGFSLSLVAMIEHIQEITPKEINATMMAILQGVHFGLGALVANVVGGKVYELFGGRILFRSKAIICGVWTILMIIYYGSKHFSNNIRRNDNDASLEYNFSENQFIEVGIDNRAKDIVEINMLKDTKQM